MLSSSARQHMGLATTIGAMSRPEILRRDGSLAGIASSSHHAVHRAALESQAIPVQGSGRQGIDETTILAAHGW